MKKATYKTLALTASLLAAVVAPGHAAEEGGEAHHAIEHQTWSFGGFTGQFDKAQLQRGFQVYKEVCSACHGLKHLSFRNLAEPGGPEFPEASVKALAAEWPNRITDGPDDSGKMFERPAKLSDPILGPYKNDKEARAAQNGALPPDLSLIAKARSVHNEAFWPKHVLLMARDIVKGYQEGGPDYIYALMTGYKEPPAGVTVAEGMHYNVAFPSKQLAMPPPLADDVVAYEDGTPTKVANYAQDVSAFLAWAADPSLNARKRIGWQVLLYLLITTTLLYFAKKRIWSKIGH
jgi:cytochrome c1